MSRTGLLGKMSRQVNLTTEQNDNPTKHQGHPQIFLAQHRKPLLRQALVNFPYPITFSRDLRSLISLGLYSGLGLNGGLHLLVRDFLRVS